MTEDNKSLLKILNASGFLFQIRIENLIHDLSNMSGIHWNVHSSEHRWIDQYNNQERFIDLILHDVEDKKRIIIEVKRVRDGTWVFISDEKKKFSKLSNLLWTFQKHGHGDLADWNDFYLAPNFPESSFCIVRGQGEKDQPMLEHLAGLVLRSTESLANQELAITKKTKEANIKFYIPIIGTNANLQICYVDYDDIDIETGTLLDASFEPVSIIRFKKNLSSTTPPIRKPSNLLEASHQQNRSIIVMNPDALHRFLFDFEIGNYGDWPWPLE